MRFGQPEQAAEMHGADHRFADLSVGGRERRISRFRIKQDGLHHGY